MPKFIDLTGRRYERLTVVRQDGRIHNRPAWLCRCDCGKEVRANAGELNAGRAESCGCLHRQRVSKMLSELKTTHGGSGTRLYTVWNAMKRRGFNEHCKEYPLYGGRGIVVCDEWRESFEAFRDWAIGAGYDVQAPRGQCTIDRIDVNGNYCPENCRWATQSEQCNNRQKNHFLDIRGEKKTIAAWSKVSGIPSHTIYDRIRSGWDAERAVFAPPQKGGEPKVDNENNVSKS